MSKPTAAGLARRLVTDRRFTGWRELPTAFIEDGAQLSRDDAVDLAGRLWKLGEHRFLYAAVTMLERHPAALRTLRWRELEPLGEQMRDWGAVDQFAALAGPAWREGRLSDARVLRWTRSANRWWRRAALVCTVALNRHSRGGHGDVPRTLAICARLADDRDDMVAKGMSWALRELIQHDRRAVERFLREHDDELPALVKREVRNKLTTGVKNPSRRKRGAGA